MPNGKELNKYQRVEYRNRDKKTVILIIAIAIVIFITTFIIATVLAIQASGAQIPIVKQKVPPSTVKPVDKPVVITESIISAKYTPPPAPKVQSPPVTTGTTVWDALAACESGGRWDYNGPSGFDGGLQFLPSTWNSFNTGYAFAWQAPREVQIATAIKLQAVSGWHSQWPSCSNQLHLPYP